MLLNNLVQKKKIAGKKTIVEQPYWGKKKWDKCISTFWQNLVKLHLVKLDLLKLHFAKPHLAKLHLMKLHLVTPFFVYNNFLLLL